MNILHYHAIYAAGSMPVSTCSRSSSVLYIYIYIYIHTLSLYLCCRQHACIYLQPLQLGPLYIYIYIYTITVSVLQAACLYLPAAAPARPW